MLLKANKLNLYLRNIRRISIGTTATICFAPALLFNIRQFQETNENLDHHVDVLERIFEHQINAGTSDFSTVNTLIHDVLGEDHNYLLVNNSDVLLEHVSNDRKPLVYASRELVIASNETYRLDASLSVAGKIPIMIFAALMGFTFFFVITSFLRRKIFNPWKDLLILEELQNQKLLVLSKLGSDWIWQTDRELNFVFISEKNNTKLCNSLLSGKKMWELDLLLPDQPWSEIIEKMKRFESIECKIIFDDGRERKFYEFLGMPQFDNDGSFNCYLGITHDISYVLQREANFQNQQNKLIRFVDEKAVDLLSAKLAAEEANMAKSRFLSTMSHEIRTPLNAIMGLTHLLLRTRLNFKQREYVETVISSSELLLSIINDILDLSKIESGKYELAINEFRINSLLDDVVPLVVPRAQAKGLELILDISGNLTMYSFFGDQKRLSQALLNYLSNALKFTETGHVVVRISQLDDKELESQGLVRMKFSVNDTGIGIAPPEQAKLFNLFQQVDDSRTRSFEGSGLGLYIVKSIANMMQGDAGLSSVPGMGSSFWFTAVVRIGSQSPLFDSSPVLPSLRNLKVLLIDDNITTLEILSSNLAGLGLQVHSRDNGINALNLIYASDKIGQAFDVVVIDWFMQGSDGLALAKTIRKADIVHQPKLLCLTSMDLSEMSSADKDNFDAAYAKPIEAGRLARIFQHLCSEKSHDSNRIFFPVEPDHTITGKFHESSTLEGTRILVVDDDRVSLQLAEIILGSAGMTISTASNGKEALHLLVTENSYDLALLDIQMPELDGVALSEIIRTIPKLAKLPLIALTALALDNEIENLKNSCFDSIITKPYKRDQLLSEISRFLNKHVSNDIQGSIAVAASLYDRLHALLIAGDPIALSFAENNLSQLKQNSGESYPALINNLRTYAFEEAIKLVTKLRTELDTNLSNTDLINTLPTTIELLA